MTAWDNIDSSKSDPIADLKQAFQDIKDGKFDRPMHICSRDGHVVLLGGRRCAECFKIIREVPFEEKEFIRSAIYGEFNE